MTDSVTPDRAIERTLDQDVIFHGLTRGYLYLAIAIVDEVIATSALKASDGFSKLTPSIIVVVGFGVAFYSLSLLLETIPMGIAYAIWAGLGIVLISVEGLVLFVQNLDLAAVTGITLIISGVVIMNVFSNSTGH